MAAAATVAAYDDTAALDAFADAVDVVTFEFENVPAASVARLAARVPVRPSWTALEVAQDRLAEKDFCRDLGIGTAPYATVTGADSLAAALHAMNGPAILKTTRLGYDGKGQQRLAPDADCAAAWAAHGADIGILEGMVPFVRELSVIVARGTEGETACFDLVENRHEAGILATTIAPAPSADAVAEDARRIAITLAGALDLVGLLAVELFETADGTLLVNEMAPRPHNSGHWTQDACRTDQFEQFTRAVCGLPLGDPSRHSDCTMDNLIGHAADRWPDLLADPAAKLHLYGKAEAREGRKMGHVNYPSRR